MTVFFTRSGVGPHRDVFIFEVYMTVEVVWKAEIK